MEPQTDVAGSYSEDSKEKGMKFVKKLLTGVTLAAVGFAGFLWAESPTKPNVSTQSPLAQDAKNEALPTPLPAEMFQGRVREAYKAAADIPEVFASVSCYCGCDKSHGHKSLLYCFADDHGAG
jgi:hypothetical protein